MRYGLVLEGGAMRGLFTAGVTDVFMENGIDFDGVIGVSAGATFGCNYKSGQIGRTLRYNKRFCRDPRYASLASMIFTGNLYNAKFDYGRLPDELDPFDRETFRSNPQEFWCVCTDADTGRAYYHRCTDGETEDMNWIRASASMPVASKPVVMNGHRYLDGGISDSVPLRFFEKRGYGKNVVILTQPAGYRKEPQSHQRLLSILLRKYPAVMRRLRRRHVDYNRQIDYVWHEAAEGAAHVICPPGPLSIGSVEHNPDELQRVYDIGRTVGLRELEPVREFLRGTGSSDR